jgi:hypothetical protein
MTEREKQLRQRDLARLSDLRRSLKPVGETDEETDLRTCDEMMGIHHRMNVEDASRALAPEEMAALMRRHSSHFADLWPTWKAIQDTALYARG